MINEYAHKKSMSYRGCYKFKEVNQKPGRDEYFCRKENLFSNPRTFPSTSTHKQYDQNMSVPHISIPSTFRMSEYSKIKIKESQNEASSIYRSNCKAGLTGQINDSPFQSIGMVKLSEKSRYIKIKEVKKSSISTFKCFKPYDNYLLKNNRDGHNSDAFLLKNKQTNAPNFIGNTSISVISPNRFSSKKMKELDYPNYKLVGKEKLGFKFSQTSHYPRFSSHAKTQISRAGFYTLHKSPISVFGEGDVSTGNPKNVTEKKIKFREKNEPLKVIKSFRNDSISSSDGVFSPPYIRKEKVLKKTSNIHSNIMSLAPTKMNSNYSQSFPKDEGLNESGTTNINLKISPIPDSRGNDCMPVKAVESSTIFPTEDLKLGLSDFCNVYPTVPTSRDRFAAGQLVRIAAMKMKETTHSTHQKKSDKLCLIKEVPEDSCQITGKHKRGLPIETFLCNQYPVKHSTKNKFSESSDLSEANRNSFTHFKESNDNCKIISDFCPMTKPMISPNVPEKKVIQHVPNKILDIQQQSICENFSEEIVSNALKEECNEPVIQPKEFSKIKENISPDVHYLFLQKMQKHLLKKAAPKILTKINSQETEKKINFTKSTDDYAKNLATHSNVKNYILPKDKKCPFIQFREKAVSTDALESLFIPTTNDMNKSKQKILDELCLGNKGEICVKDIPVPTSIEMSGMCERASSNPSFIQNIPSSSEVDLHQSMSDKGGELDPLIKTKPSAGDSSDTSFMEEKSKTMGNLPINSLEQSPQLSVTRQSLPVDNEINSEGMSRGRVIPPSRSTDDFTKSILWASETLQTYPPMDKDNIKKMVNVCVMLNRNATLEKFMSERTSNFNREVFYVSTVKMKEEIGNFSVLQQEEETAFSMKFEEESMIDIKLEPLNFELLYPVKEDKETNSENKSKIKSKDESKTSLQEIPEDGRVIIKEEHIEEEDKDQPLPRSDRQKEMFENFDKWLKSSLNDGENSLSEQASNHKRSSLRVFNYKNKAKSEPHSQEAVSNSSKSLRTKKLKKKKKGTQRSNSKRLKGKSNHRKTISKINSTQSSKIIENLIEVLPYRNDELLSNQEADGSVLRKCLFCGVFAIKKAFDQHVFTHKVKLFYHCPICNFKSKRRYVVFKHIKAHERESSNNTSSIQDCSAKLELYRCKLCSFENIMYDLVQRHIENHLTEDRATMRFNKKSKQLPKRLSSKKSSSQLSCKQVNLPKKFCCDICQMKLNSLVDLKLHKMIHPKKKSFKVVQCPICCFKCLKYATLKTHVLQHSELDFESSSESSPRLSRSDKIKSRRKSPKKDISMSHSKNIVCPICSKPFLQVSTFQAHISVCCKTVEKPSTVKKKAKISRIALRSKRSMEVQDDSKTLIKSKICKDDSNDKIGSVTKLDNEEMYLKESMEFDGEQNMCFTKFKKKDTANRGHDVISTSVCDSSVSKKHGRKPFVEDLMKKSTLPNVSNESMKNTEENPVGNLVYQKDTENSVFDLSKVKLEQKTLRENVCSISSQPNKPVSLNSSSKFEDSFRNLTSEHIDTVSSESVISSKSSNLNEPRNIESLLPRFHEDDYNHSLSSALSGASTSMNKPAELKSKVKNEFNVLGHDIAMFSINNDQSFPLSFKDNCMKVIKSEILTTQNSGKEITSSVPANDPRNTNSKGNSLTLTSLKVNKNVETNIESTESLGPRKCSPRWVSNCQKTSELNLLNFGTPVLSNTQEFSSVSSVPIMYEKNNEEPLDLSTFKPKANVSLNKDLPIKIKSETSSEVISSLHFPVGINNINKNLASDHDQCASGNSGIIQAPPAHSSGHFELPQFMPIRVVGKSVSEPAMSIVSSSTLSKESNSIPQQSSLESLKESTKFHKLISAHNESVSTTSHQSVTACNPLTEISSFVKPTHSFKGVFQESSFAALSRQSLNVSTHGFTKTKSIQNPVPILFGDNKMELSRSIGSTCVEKRNEVKEVTSVSSSEMISESKEFQKSLPMKSESKRDYNEQGSVKENSSFGIQQNTDTPLWEGVSSKLRVKVKIVDGEMTAEIINKSQYLEDSNEPDLKSNDGKETLLPQSTLISSQRNDSHSISEKCHLFKCSFCEFHTDKLFKLNTHLEGHSERNPFECSFCPETFPNAALLKTHIKEH